jgi:hypothetical protein
LLIQQIFQSVDREKERRRGEDQKEVTKKQRRRDGLVVLLREAGNILGELVAVSSNGVQLLGENFFLEFEI